ncbi:MAG: hypothetical protein AB8C02_05705 [Halioglobus sp.]
MDTRYHILFAGELLEGHALADVQANIAKLFKADDATLAKLFSGKTQTIKRNCDRATAAKYKAAIEKAGGKPIVKVAQEQETAEQPPSQPTTQPTTQPSAEPKSEPAPQSAAEKIAALAAAADVPVASAPEPAVPPVQQTNSSAVDDGPFGLAEAGSDVLREDERSHVEPADIDTSSLLLDEHVDRLSPEAQAAPSAPDTSHLDLGEVGATIPTLPLHEAQVNPNTDNISLAPEGGDLSDCAPDAPEIPNLDLSALDLAPAGTEVLEEKYRKQDTAVAPDTDHLALDD